jgi:hypothetical protein
LKPYQDNRKHILKNKQSIMKRNLLIGIIGGAAVGAAASYLLDSGNRSNLGQGLKNIGSKAGDFVGGIIGSENESNSGSSASNSSNRNSSGTSGTRNSSRRG